MNVFSYFPEKTHLVPPANLIFRPLAQKLLRKNNLKDGAEVRQYKCSRENFIILKEKPTNILTFFN